MHKKDWLKLTERVHGHCSLHERRRLTVARNRDHEKVGEFNPDRGSCAVLYGSEWEDYIAWE